MLARKILGGSGLLVAASIALSSFGALPAKADDMDEWKRKVATMVAKNQGYPRSAQVRKLEGSAKVKLVIEATGDISSFELVESTTHDILDKEVDKLVEKINPLPATPDSSQMTLVLPLTWRLN